MVIVITVAFVSVESSDEGLPLRSSDDLRPLTDLQEGGEGGGPPPLVARRGLVGG